MADQSQDIDQLLDSALDDFQNLNLISSAKRGAEIKGDNTENDKKESSGAQLEDVKGLGMGLPDLKNKKKGKQKVSQPSSMQESHISEAIDKLREQAKEAVKGLEAAAGPKQQPTGEEAFGGDAMMEDFVKQFEQLAGSQDMESIVETMMQQLLSKEILHEPMKEIGERYPKWLDENKTKITSEEYARYSHQHNLIRELNQVYESDPNNFNKIVELMQKMQECGQPPDDIVQELGPEFDLSTLGQLSPEMLESQQNCCVI